MSWRGGTGNQSPAGAEWERGVLVRLGSAQGPGPGTGRGPGVMWLCTPRSSSWRAFRERLVTAPRHLREGPGLCRWGNQGPAWLCDVSSVTKQVERREPRPPTLCIMARRVRAASSQGQGTPLLGVWLVSFRCAAEGQGWHELGTCHPHAHAQGPFQLACPASRQSRSFPTMLIIPRCHYV